jgi:hypothetical protein
MSMDDDDVKAMENRLRTNGWTSKPEPYFQASRVRPAANSLMPIEAKVAQAARWLAHTFGKDVLPPYQEIADEFGLSYDDAVRTVGEAKRIAGQQ